MTQTKGLHGWWRLASFEMETQGSDERQHPFGANASGRIVFSPDGLMIAVITAQSRKAGQSDADHRALLQSMLAYTGIFRVEGDKVITKVDASWNEEWTGTEQVRFYKLNGDRLDIVAAWHPHPFDPSSPPIRGILSWRREA